MAAALAMVYGFAFANASISAEEIRYASENDIVRLASQESNTSFPVQLIGHESCDGSVTDCDSGCDSGCGCPTITGGGELLFLKPFQSEGNWDDFNYRTGYRGWFGYQRGDGLGVRLRTFDYFQRDINDARVDINSIDLEVFDLLVANGQWDLTVGGGIRYLDYFVGSGPDPDDGYARYGLGPVVSAELMRHVNDRLSLYAFGREALLAGNGNDYGTVEADCLGNVFELQLGAQWARELGIGLVFGRIGWEAQSYTSMDDGDTESLTLMGGVLSGGIVR